MIPKKIVITGGPSTGKTSLIEALEVGGYHCFPEVIRMMTLEAKKNGELKSFSTNPIALVSNPMDFNKKILYAREKHFSEANSSSESVVFFDRGIPDIIAYMDYFNQQHTPEFVASVKEKRYDTVFLLPVWKDIYVSDDERFESYEEALEIHDCLKKSYQKFDYEVIEVPKVSVSDRIDFILQKLKI